MSNLHGAARRLAGLLNDSEGAGLVIWQNEDEFTVTDPLTELTLSVVQNKDGKWEVGD